MKKTKLLTVLLTDDQHNILEARARSEGFLKVSEYVRSMLFVKRSTQEKIDEIHKKVCK